MNATLLAHPTIAKLYAKRNATRQELFDMLVATTEQEQEVQLSTKKDAQQARPYIPKYNTFEAYNNQDLHAEQQDEHFERANTPINIQRAQGLGKQLHLKIADVTSVAPKLAQHYFKNTSQMNDDLYNYLHVTTFSQEQATEVLRQLSGENEKLLLNNEQLWQEIEYHIMQKGTSDKKKKAFKEHGYVLEATREYRLQYLTFVRTLDYQLCVKGNVDVQLLSMYPCTLVPLTLECIGYLATYYYMPWRVYTWEQFERVLLPWDLIEEAALQHDALQKLQKAHSNMYKQKLNRIVALQCMGEQEEAENEQVRIELEEAEKVIGKQVTFYKNEKKRYLDKEQESEGEQMFQYLSKYEQKQKNKQAVKEWLSI